MNLPIWTKITGRYRRLDAAESGAALTEFAITLPIFVLLMTAVMQLGNMGQATVQVKTAAYAQMWANSYAETDSTVTDNPSVFTTRDELMGAVPAGLNADQIIDSVDSMATAAGGHWGEAMMKANLALLLSGGQISHYRQDTDGATRLTQNLDLTTAPHSAMTTILGASRDSRPSFAVNDNLIDDELANHVSDMEGISGITSSILSSVLTGTGMVPSLMAGIRHGEARGTASSQVRYENTFLSHTANYSASYTTGLSPHAGSNSAIPGFDIEFSGVGREETQWFFYYLTGQAVDNKRVALDIFEIGWDASENFDNPDRYELDD